MPLWVDICIRLFVGSVCCVSDSCDCWFMMLLVASLDWGGCMVRGIGYWNGAVVVVVLWMSGFVLRCGSMALVCVLYVCMGVSTALVW